LDATIIRADIDKTKVNKQGSSDPDARYGFKKGEPGYKQHTVADGKARVVVDVSVTPADRSEHDSAIESVERAIANVEQTPEAVCADAAYASGRNRERLEERGIRLISPPPKPITYTGRDYFTTEDFAYDASRDVFICPAGRTLKCVGVVKDRPQQKRYRALRTDCRVCSLKTRCTVAERRTLKVGVHHAALVRLRADAKTDSFKELYHARSPVIEGVFAEAKQWHGLRRAWRRGLSNMLIQSLLTAAVLNFKRLMTAQRPIAHLLGSIAAVCKAVSRVWGTIPTVQRVRWIINRRTRFAA
jgi:hypothetical protein